MKDHGRWVMIALALALLLAMTALAFAGCDNGSGSGGAADPEDAVDSFFEALEDQDIDALMELLDPDSLEELEDDLGSGFRKDLKDYFFAWLPDDAGFKGLKYDTDIDGDEAEVEVIKARVTYEDDYGDADSEDIATSDEPITFDLVMLKGKWYITVDSFPDIDEDDATFSDLFAYFYDDYDDYDYDDDYDGTSEVKVVEAAMLSYLKANAAEGLEFVLRNLQIYGDEAVGVFECTNMDLEWPMVYMVKDSGGWYGVNAGTGFEPPSWYDWDW